MGGSDHFLHAAYYSLRDGLSSSLAINNATTVNQTARVTLYSKNGKPLIAPDINLLPNQSRFFSIADWLASDASGEFSEGSLEVFFHGPSMGVGSQLTVTDSEHRLNFDDLLTETMDFMSLQVESLWWHLDKNTQAKVFIANTKTTPTNVTPTFFVDGLPITGDSITLVPHQVQTLDIGQALDQLKLAHKATTGGLRIAYDNGAGAIAIAGVITNARQGFASTMRFTDLSMLESSTLQGAYLPLGSPAAGSGFASGTKFVPHAIVRNTTDKPVQVTGRVRYVLNDQPTTVKLAPINLQANAVSELDLRPALAAVGAQSIADSGLELEYSNAPGAVIAAVASVDQSGAQVFDVPMKDPKEMMTMFKGGSYPWHIDGDNRAVVHIKNLDPDNDDKPREAVARLVYDGGIYYLPLQTIAVGHTLAIDIKALRDNRVKDTLGNVLPLTVTSGQFAWYARTGKGTFTGRLVQYNPVTGLSSSFSCVQNCLCNMTYNNGWNNPDSLSGIIGDSFSFSAVEQDVDCNGATYAYTVGPSQGVSFSSADTSIVTVSGSTATIVGVGRVDVSSDWSAQLVNQACDGLSADGECVSAECATSFLDGGGTTTVFANPQVGAITYTGGSSTPTTTSTAYVLLGSTVAFTATPNPTSATWPAGAPHWGGTAGAAATGATYTVTFNTLSTSATDYKTVTATNINPAPVTVNVVVFSLSQVRSIRDSFAGRSTTKLGLKELVDLSYSTSPTLTADQIGGLKWVLTGGTGDLNDPTGGLNPQDDGTGRYQAPGTADTATLQLQVTEGPSKGTGPSFSYTIVAPSGGSDVRVASSTIWHCTGTVSAGFAGHFFLTPTDVSFSQLMFFEGGVAGVGTGYFASLNGGGHPVGMQVTIGHCSTATGCQVTGTDRAYNSIQPVVMPFASGSFTWPIPWFVVVDFNIVQFTTANHVTSCDATGAATISKAGAGPFTTQANDPTSQFGGQIPDVTCGSSN